MIFDFCSVCVITIIHVNSFYQSLGWCRIGAMEKSSTSWCSISHRFCKIVKILESKSNNNIKNLRYTYTLTRIIIQICICETKSLRSDWKKIAQKYSMHCERNNKRCAANCISSLDNQLTYYINRIAIFVRITIRNNCFCLESDVWIESEQRKIYIINSVILIFRAL